LLRIDIENINKLMFLKIIVDNVIDI
jgi:hypothetical protein